MKSLLLTLALAATPETVEQAPPNAPSAALATTEARSAPEADDVDPEAEALKRLAPDQLMQLMLEKEKTKQQKTREIQSDIAVPFAFFLFLALAVTFKYFTALRTAKLHHETLRSMLEKGVTLSPELLEPLHTPRSPLSRGLSLIAVGIGLIILLNAVAGGGTWTAGLIPLFLGIAKLVAWKLESRSDASNRAVRSP